MSDADDKPSRSQRKRDADAAHDLGAELVAMDRRSLDALELPEELRTAVELAKRIKSRSGLRRQVQYVAQLVRSVDTGPIRERLAARQARHHGVSRGHQRVKDWRDAVLRGEMGVLQEVADAAPGIDRSRLEALAFRARDEHAAGRPPRHARELFRFIRDALELPADG